MPDTPDPVKITADIEEAINRLAEDAPEKAHALRNLLNTAKALGTDVDWAAAATGLKDITRELREAASSSQALEQGVITLIQTLTGVTETSTGLTAGFARMAFGAEGLQAAMETLGGKISDILTPTNIGISVFKKFAEASVALTLSVDNATTAFAKASGTGSKYKDVIKAAEYQNRHLGVSAAEAGAATAALHSGFTEFLMMSEDAQKALTANVAEFETFGVAAATTTKFLQNVTRTTKLTIPEASRLQKSVMGTASAFGDDLNKVLEETAEVMPKLAIHSRNLEGTLENLYAASKRTGMGMSEIVSFAERFDTFETAAQAAGNLNAVLGQMGGAPLVDTMQILEETDPAKRMQLFADAIEQSVGDFEELDYYQQRAVANAMGMSVEETRRILLQEEQTSKLQAAMDERGLTEEKMIELQTEGRDLMTEVKILALQFAVSLQGPLKAVKGIVSALSGGLQRINDLKDAADEAFGDNSVTGKAIAALGGLAKLGVGLAATAGIMLALKTLVLRGSNPLMPMWTATVSAAGGAGGKVSQFLGSASPLGRLTGVLIGVGAAIVGVKASLKMIEQEKEESKKKRMGVGMVLGGILGAVIGTMLFPGAGTAAGWTAGTAIAAGVGLGAGAVGGTMIGGMQHGAYASLGGKQYTTPKQVMKPTTVPVGPTNIAKVGEHQTKEAIIPLNEEGRRGIGMDELNKATTKQNGLLEQLIKAVSNREVVVFRRELERMGVMFGDQSPVTGKQV